jgi:hypothetical protein
MNHIAVNGYQGVIMDFLAALLEIMGGFLVGNRIRIGFIINILAGLSWIVVSVGIHYGFIDNCDWLIGVCVAMILVNIRNYRRWGRLDRRTK